MKSMGKLKVSIHTLGCKVNQYESELISEQFASHGDEIAGENEFADVYIINTCTVTGIADRKSRQIIRRKKKINKDALIVVTGCYAQVASEEVEKIDDVDIVIGNNLKSTIYETVHRLIDIKSREKIVSVLPLEDLNCYEDMGISSGIASGRTRAYIKIQEGCNRFCSYCMIPFARGRIRSRSLDDIISEVHSLLENGVKEIVLTGINTALYGFDFEKKNRYPLSELIEKIDEIEGDFRIRLSSLEPTVVNKDDVMSLIGYDKLARHLHLSAQSGSTNILKKMNRTYDRNGYLEIVRAIRDYHPLYGISTDIIVGFPEESEKDFEDSLTLLSEAEFCRVHAFKYSPRKGTKAASFKNRVDSDIKNRRIDKLISEASKVSLNFVNKNKMTLERVLTEERAGDYVTGYTGNYIKAYIFDRDKKIKTGEFYDVRIIEAYEDGCLAQTEIIE